MIYQSMLFSIANDDTIAPNNVPQQQCSSPQPMSCVSIDQLPQQERCEMNEISQKENKNEVTKDTASTIRDNARRLDSSYGQYQWVSTNTVTAMEYEQEHEIEGEQDVLECDIEEEQEEPEFDGVVIDTTIKYEYVESGLQDALDQTGWINIGNGETNESGDDNITSIIVENTNPSTSTHWFWNKLRQKIT